MININKLIEMAILEDTPDGDVTQRCLGEFDGQCTAQLISKQKGIFYGEMIINACCSSHLGPIDVSLYVKDGQSIGEQHLIAELHGNISILLIIERVMLNYLQRLSGIATITNHFVKRLNNSKIQVVDTRKTTPNIRQLEKQAVIAGGGHNHRGSLSDMVLIKENHIRYFLANNKVKKLGEKIRQFKQKNIGFNVEVEIESLSQLTLFPLESVDFIMLDNFTREDIPKSIAIIRAKYPNAKIEVSGNITLDTIKLYREYDIDRISVGSLTHSVEALDLSLLLQ